MRFTSLVVELIRARPRLVFWTVVLCQAALWLIVPLLFFRSPPGDLATVLAFGREYQVGTDLGPPLAFWLADIAFRLAGNHVFGVYVLSQLCFVLAFRALYGLGSRIAGPQHAVLAVLLTMTVTAFGVPGLAFGPKVLALPLWSLALLHFWQIIGQGRRNAWFALSMEAGLLLLTTPAGTGLLLLLLIFAVATRRGRDTLLSLDPLFALSVVAALVLPYVIWLVRAHALVLPHWPAVDQLSARLLHWGDALGGLVLAMVGIGVLVVLDSRLVARNSDDAPVIFRPPVGPLAKRFVYFFALAPALLASLVSTLLGFDDGAGGPAIALLLSGLAVIVVSGDLIALRRQRILRVVWLVAVVAPAIGLVGLIVLQPWFTDREVATSAPASDIGRFFGESFERRTNRPLQAVAGDPQIAALVGLGATRPRLLLDATPQRTPWLPVAAFNAQGGIVVWRAADTAGKPPDDIAKRFPGLVPEIPRAFDRLVNGRQPTLRIGWAIVRPRTP